MTQESPAATLVCYNHPDRETVLRCNRCERPICTACAVSTPTGYRCKDCVRGQQKVFETAQWVDYPLAIGVALVLSFAGSFIASFLGFFTLFIAPLFGMFIAEAVRWVVRRRRSKLLFQLAAGGAALGGLPLFATALIGFFLAAAGGSAAGLFGLLWPGLYLFLDTSTVYYRLSGIQVR